VFHTTTCYNIIARINQTNKGDNQMSTALQIAEYLDDMDMFGIESTEIKTAGLYSVRGENTTLVAEHGDVYEMLESVEAQAVAMLSDAVVVRTCGWAAPITDGDDPEAGVAPSQHSQRRRVRLLVVAKAGETASVLRFTDDWANPIFDEGQATGSLADAVQSLFV
jgi:hypothetical protein